MRWRDLRLRLRALFQPRRADRDLDDELAFHLEMEARKLVAAGLSPADARVRARARFGSAASAADDCRDARGVAFVQTTARDIVYALRTFRRTPGVAATIVGTIALGLGLTATVFTIFSAFVFRVDAVRDPGSLFSVELVAPRGGLDRPRFTVSQYETLRRDSTGVAEMFARLSDITSRIDGRMMEGQLVSGHFFQMLGVTASLGRTLTPDDDRRDGARPVVVLSHGGWTRLFNGDAGVIGRTIPVNRQSVTIVGVTPAGFNGLSFLAPDYWAPLSLAGSFRPWLAGRLDQTAIDVTARLAPGVSRAAAEATLAASAVRGGVVAASPRSRVIRLHPQQTSLPFSTDVLLGFSPLFFAFGLILLIGSANVANLLLARALSRQREIGIRLAIGGRRRRVIRQLLTESLILALVSAVCAVMLSRVILDVTTALLVRTMPPELAEMIRLVPPGTDWRVAVFLLVAAMGATAAFALAPALQATRLDLVRVMRGELTGGARPGPGRARGVLIVTQVMASALLLICAGIFLRAAIRSATAHPGFRTADVVLLEVINAPVRDAMVAAVAAHPSVAAMAIASPDMPLSRPRPAFGSSNESGVTSAVSYRFVSPAYFEVLGIPVLQGRTYSPVEARAQAAVAVIAESTARQLYPQGFALGRTLRLEPDPADIGTGAPRLPSQSLTVIGIVRDVPGFRIAGPEAGVYVPASPSLPKFSILARVHGDPERARQALLERLVTIDPNMGMAATLRTLSRIETYPLQIAFSIAMVLGGLALVLTLSGIFSVLSYLVEQRTKEIGVRIALGASAGTVTWMVLWQSLRLVAAGLVAAVLLAWMLASLLMTTPAAVRIGSIVNLFEPLAYTSTLVVVVVAGALAASMPAFRASRISPMSALRQE